MTGSETDSGTAKPLEGIRVIEVAMYGFVPSGGAVLADWGADVIKIEHAVNGDPQRGLRRTGAFVIEEGEPNPNIEHANRGKRSLGLDISKPEGLEVLLELVAGADVFLTSFLPRARRKFGIEPGDIRAIKPDIVYARGSAFGPLGPESDKGGYDMTAFWARSSAAASISPEALDGILPLPVPAYGDTISGTNLAGGIAAALVKRERTGEGSVVDVSLLGSGVWAMGHGIALARAKKQPWVMAMPGGPNGMANPLSGIYRTSDHRHLSLVMLQPQKYWADVCRHIDRPDLADDPRFATAELIAEHAEDGVALLREVIATRPLAEWAERFVTLSGPWAPVQDSVQVGDDVQVRANKYVTRAGSLELAASPVQFGAEPLDHLDPAPEFAAHTEQILLELGMDWERIIALKEAGAVT
ncbi:MULTISPECIES: CaiB/BaiF CoA transferase family protein [unclassified Streptomyces]|uniref:CaiB/BaiF CoA transferase family protein n=1 Tax=unclassified Streptomyces TaxID=2593676 RepID=UPI002E18FA3D